MLSYKSQPILKDFRVPYSKNLPSSKDVKKNPPRRPHSHFHKNVEHCLDRSSILSQEMTL